MGVSSEVLGRYVCELGGSEETNLSEGGVRQVHVLTLCTRAILSTFRGSFYFTRESVGSAHHLHLMVVETRRWANNSLEVPQLTSGRGRIPILFLALYSCAREK